MCLLVGYYVSICIFVEIIFTTFISNRNTFISLFLYNISFSSVGVLPNLFLNLLLSYIDLYNSLFIKGDWLPLERFFFRGACLFTILGNTSVINSQLQFGSLKRNYVFLTSLRNFCSLNFL